MQQNRNQIFEIYLDDFSSFKKAKELKILILLLQMK